MSFFEFPHTRTYDSDLGWLIKKMLDILSSEASQNEKMQQLEEAMKELREYVDDYFEDPEVKELLIQQVTEAVNTWLDEHPEATTTLDVLGMPEAEAIDGNYIYTDGEQDGPRKMPADYFKARSQPLYNMPAVPIFGAGYDDPDGYTAPQGGAFAGDRLVTYYANSDSSNGTFVILDADTGVILNTQVLNAYHGNDIAYQPDEKKIYVLGSGDSIQVLQLDTSNNTLVQVGVINPSMTLQGIVYLGNDIWAAYNIEDNTMYLCDGTFSSFTPLFTDVYPGGDHRNEWYHQGLAYDGEYLYVVSKSKDALAENVIFVYALEDPNAGHYVGSIGYPKGYGELEWIDFRNGLLYSGFYSDGNTEMVRADYYKTEPGAYNPSYDLYGKTSPNYIYFNNNATNQFTTGLTSAAPIANMQYLNTILNSAINTCIRLTSGCTQLILNSYKGLLRTDGVTLERLELLNSSLELFGSASMDTVVLTNSTLMGLVTATTMELSNSIAPLLMGRTGTVNRSFAAIRPSDDATHKLHLVNDSLVFNVSRSMIRNDRFSSASGQLFHSILTGMFTLVSSYALTTQYQTLDITGYTAVPIVAAIPIPLGAVDGFEWYLTKTSQTGLHMRAASAATINILVLVFS